MHKYQRPGETCCTCASVLQGIKEVTKQVEQRINSVRPWSSQFGIEGYSKGSALWKLCSITENSSKQEITWDPSRHTISERSWSATSRTGSTKMRMYEQGYTQSDMVEFDRVANERWIYVASSGRRASHSDQYNPEDKQVPQWKEDNMTRQASEPDAEQRSSWASWT